MKNLKSQSSMELQEETHFPHFLSKPLGRYDRKKMINQLRIHEGERLKPYKCTAGKLTIGIGRNLEDRGITQAESSFLLENDIQDFTDRLYEIHPWINELNDVRQRVLVDMCFNLGLNGLLKFKKTLGAVREREYKKAAEMMLQSLWAKQVGQRSRTLAMMMETGEDPEASQW